MLNPTFHELLFIRFIIILLQYIVPIELFALVLLLTTNVLPVQVTWIVTGLLGLEFLYSAFIYFPFKVRLTHIAQHPPGLSREQREAEFDRCLVQIPDMERYLRVWHLGADISEIKRDSLRDFLLWAFFDRGDYVAGADDEEDIEDELDLYIAKMEDAMGRRIPPGRGKAIPLRLTIDVIETRYRSVIWYVIVAGIDTATLLRMAWYGFHHYSQPMYKMLLFLFPIRPQTLFLAAGKKATPSPSHELSYWYRAHKATPKSNGSAINNNGNANDGGHVTREKLPVVFIHGIGIGIHPYAKFLSEIPADIGVLVLEILPISMRLGPTPFSQSEFIHNLQLILQHHDIDRFVLASHSYGSVLSTHILHSPDIAPKVAGVVLIDPVTMLLFLPDVAYNFTRRKPKTANEWQLWYFASMDPGIASVLGRHFFWRENLIWKEELLSLDPLSFHDGHTTGAETPVMKRKAAISISSRDLIVDTITIARYLVHTESLAELKARGDNHDAFADALDRASGAESSRATSAEDAPPSYMTKSGVELLWFPRLDHAQVFDASDDRKRLVDVITRFCES